MTKADKFAFRGIEDNNKIILIDLEQAIEFKWMEARLKINKKVSATDKELIKNLKEYRGQKVSRVPINKVAVRDE